MQWVPLLSLFCSINWTLITSQGGPAANLRRQNFACPPVSSITFAITTTTTTTIEMGHGRSGRRVPAKQTQSKQTDIDRQAGEMTFANEERGKEAKNKTKIWQLTICGMCLHCRVLCCDVTTKKKKKKKRRTLLGKEEKDNFFLFLPEGQTGKNEENWPPKNTQFSIAAAAILISGRPQDNSRTI